MKITGKVKNGVVVLDEGEAPPDGTPVEVVPLMLDRNGVVQSEPTLFDELRPLIGCIGDLPADFARNHDHYLHGAPRP